MEGGVIGRLLQPTVTPVAIKHVCQVRLEIHVIERQVAFRANEGKRKSLYY